MCSSFSVLFMLYGIDGTKFWETEEENGNNLFLLIVPEI